MNLPVLINKLCYQLSIDKSDLFDIKLRNNHTKRLVMLALYESGYSFVDIYEYWNISYNNVTYSIEKARRIIKNRDHAEDFKEIIEKIKYLKG